jgi:ketosteroid isomerase-like protein
LFARDVVLVYAGGPDRTYGQACRQFRALISSPDRRVSYRHPAIRRVRLDGDLAAVRLVWTATIRDGAGTVLERTREDGVDVMRRGRDGRWRIVLSHAFPLT